MVLLWGKYTYQLLAMSIGCVPNMFQLIMQELVGDLNILLVYINGFPIIQWKGKTQEDH